MKPIHHTFAPLADASCCRKALALLPQPWRWRAGEARRELRAELGHAFGGDAFLFASGREALLAGLKALRAERGDEVIVQGYTCVVVPNAVEAAGLKTVYADIDPDTLNLTAETVEPLLTPRTRAVICQHTFGIPADLSSLRALCSARGLILIEDCAHIMPDASGPTGIGRTGDMALFSFGRDKAVSGVAGGALLVRVAELSGIVRVAEATAQDVPASRVARYLLYPLLYCLAKPLYGIFIGKALLAASAKLGLLPPVVERREKAGDMDATLHRLPNAMAELALSQICRLKQINDHRRALTSFYLKAGKDKGLWRSGGEDPVPAGVMEGLPMQKFPLFVPNADLVRKTLKARNIHLDDGWTGCVICPRAVDQAAVGYVPGSDPKAEHVATSILSLPTHPTMTEKQARKLLEELIRAMADWKLKVGS
jgi:perosamine synthetase